MFQVAKKFIFIIKFFIALLVIFGFYFYIEKISESLAISCPSGQHDACNQCVSDWGWGPGCSNGNICDICVIGQGCCPGGPTGFHCGYECGSGGGGGGGGGGTGRTCDNLKIYASPSSTCSNDPTRLTWSGSSGCWDGEETALVTGADLAGSPVLVVKTNGITAYPKVTTAYKITSNCKPPKCAYQASNQTTVTVRQCAPSVTLVATPASIMGGRPVTLTWTAIGATKVDSSDFGATAVSGTMVVYPSASRSYSITVKDDAGQKASATVSVTVTPSIRNIAIYPANVTLNPKAKQGYKAIAYYSNDTQKDVTLLATWSVDQKLGIIGKTLISYFCGYVGGCTSTYGMIFTAADVSKTETGQVYASYTDPTSPAVNTGSANVTVVLLPESLSIAPFNPTLNSKDVQQFTATVKYPGGATKDVTMADDGLGGNTNTDWSADNNIGVISNTCTKVCSGGGGCRFCDNVPICTLQCDKGKLAAADVNSQQQGNVWARYTEGYAGQSKTVEANTGVTVKPIGGVVTIIGLEIRPPTKTMNSGETQQFDAYVLYSDGSSKKVTDFSAWSVSSASLGQVDLKGNFQAATVSSPQNGLINAIYLETRSSQPVRASAQINVLPIGGGSSNVSGWIWSENIGWISLNCSNNNSCGVVNYGVSVDKTTGKFSGYGWSEHIGWVDVSPISGYPTAPTYGMTLDLVTKKVSGWLKALTFSSETVICP